MEKKIAWQIQHDEHCYELLKIAAEEGFKAVAIGFGSSKCFHNDDWEKEVERLKTALFENGLRCVMTHAPYYDLRISAEVNDEAMEKALLRCVTATKMLGAEICAVHPRAYFEDGDGDEVLEKSFECNHDNFMPLVREAEKLGVMIGIENLPIFPGWDKTFYSCYTDEHKRLIDCYNSSAVCGIWDFGHAHLTGIRAFDKNPKDMLLELGSRIKGTHVHNNFLTRDDHLPPGMGTINWEEVLDALKSTGFNGYLTLEVDYNFDFAIKPFARYMYESVEKLDDIMKKL